VGYLLQSNSEKVKDIETKKDVKGNKIYENIAKHIKQQILNGDLAPGQRLPSVKELCDRYDVSRPSVREALSALKVMGLIETKQGEGSTVKAYTPMDIDMSDFQQVLINDETMLELVEAREALELTNSRLAAVKRTNEDLKKLQEIINKMEFNLLTKDIKESEQLDMLFHLTIAQSTHNSIIVRLLETISAPLAKSMQEIRKLCYSDLDFHQILFDMHRAIYLAILKGEPSLAEQAMLNHLSHFEELIKKNITRQ
jgi:GntR family transcriptional repressor for pyruvate dehydrogenase complex